MKKILKACIAFVMLVSTTACANTSGQNVYEPGVYSGTAAGHNGDITVEIEVDESSILSAKVIEHQETEGIAEPALERIPELVVEHQALGLDTVTGCTVTSNAILSAIANAIDNAGGDSKALKEVKYSEPQGDKIVKTADVIVVGGGGAGVSATLSAAQNDASVILVEKTASLGGNTIVAGGGWNVVDPELDNATENQTGRSETLESILEIDESTIDDEYLETFRTVKQQIEEYLNSESITMYDSVEFHILQTYLGGKRTDLDGNTIYSDFDLIEQMCSKSLETRDWLIESAGSEFKDYLEEPLGAMWLRANKPQNKKVDYFDKPIAAAEQLGAEVMYETRATELIVEEGRVTGIIAVQKNGTEVELHANKGVILTTGGFAGNSEMVLKYNNYWEGLNPTMGSCNVSSTVGDGLIMAEKVDAQLTGMEFTQIIPIAYATTGKLAMGKGSNVIYVNPQGERFVNEYAERDVLSRAAFEFGGEDGLFYEIGSAVNAPTTNAYDCYQADTLEELAEMIGIDPAVLTETVETYNQYVETGVDPDFNKNVFEGKIESPYMARAMKPVFHHTMGGLKIDTDCHVYNNSDEIIPGLYAAGEVTGGIHAGNRLGGNAITDIFVYGKIAGESAALSK